MRFGDAPLGHILPAKATTDARGLASNSQALYRAAAAPRKKASVLHDAARTRHDGHYYRIKDFAGAYDSAAKRRFGRSRGRTEPASVHPIVALERHNRPIREAEDTILYEARAAEVYNAFNKTRREDSMVARKQELRPDEPAGNRQLAGFAQAAKVWLNTQSEILDAVETMMSDWARRRREALNAAQRSVAQMRECRDWSDWLRVQQEWLAGSAQRLTEDYKLLGNTTLDAVQRAATGLTGTIETGSQRATEMLRAAGDKPARRVERL